MIYYIFGFQNSATVHALFENRKGVKKLVIPNDL